MSFASGPIGLQAALAAVWSRRPTVSLVTSVFCSHQDVRSLSTQSLVGSFEVLTTAVLADVWQLAPSSIHKLLAFLLGWALLGRITCDMSL